jgi:hypothetical protein
MFWEEGDGEFVEIEAHAIFVLKIYFYSFRLKLLSVACARV